MSNADMTKEQENGNPATNYVADETAEKLSEVPIIKVKLGEPFKIPLEIIVDKQQRQIRIGIDQLSEGFVVNTAYLDIEGLGKGDLEIRSITRLYKSEPPFICPAGESELSFVTDSNFNRSGSDSLYLLPRKYPVVITPAVYNVTAQQGQKISIAMLYQGKRFEGDLTHVQFGFSEKQPGELTAYRWINPDTKQSSFALFPLTPELDVFRELEFVIQQKQ